MSAGFHLSEFCFKTFRILLRKQRRIGTCASGNGTLACYLSSRQFSSSQDHLWSLKSVDPTLAFPKVNEPRSSENLDIISKKGMQYNVSESDGWINIGDYRVFAWSVSGLESCVIVKSGDLQIAFDMGISVPESIQIPNVFITHGHIDHVGAITSHVAKRGNTGMKSARYFLPPHLIHPLNTILRTHSEMAETPQMLEAISIQPFTDKDDVRLNSRYIVKAFATIHRIPSQGYIVYKENKTLKVEYEGLESSQVATLLKKGVDVYDLVMTPEIAYCGDTVFDVFVNPPNPDLLKVKILITEATFIDDTTVLKAKARGHTHLMEIVQNAEIFKNVGHIILVHFSNKYSPKYIQDSVISKLPTELQNKVTPATVAKATVATTFLQQDSEFS